MWSASHSTCLALLFLWSPIPQSSAAVRSIWRTFSGSFFAVQQSAPSGWLCSFISPKQESEWLWSLSLPSHWFGVFLHLVGLWITVWHKWQQPSNFLFDEFYIINCAFKKAMRQPWHTPIFIFNLAITKKNPSKSEDFGGFLFKWGGSTPPRILLQKNHGKPNSLPWVFCHP